MTLDNISLVKKYQLIYDNCEINTFNDIETAKTAMVLDIKDRYGLFEDPDTDQDFLFYDYRIIEVLVPKLIDDSN